MTEREIAGQAGNDETERIKPAIKGIAADRRRPFSRAGGGRRGRWRACARSGGEIAGQARDEGKRVRDEEGRYQRVLLREGRGNRRLQRLKWMLFCVHIMQR